MLAAWVENATNMVQERNIEGVGDGMVEGGAALGMGIYRGFTGLVTKPVEGAKSKGMGGNAANLVQHTSFHCCVVQHVASASARLLAFHAMIRVQI